ncbi:hypothetical protein ACIGHG_12575 [Bacillus sp. NPDC077411]|uniref:Uncharacterized protein n=1 Tax=Bacillus bruguierae TaxID=3127667 RepID=A0ABU8FP60_9BACI
MNMWLNLLTTTGIGAVIGWAQTAADKLLMNEQTLHEVLKKLDMIHMEERVTKQIENDYVFRSITWRLNWSPARVIINYTVIK